MPRVLTPEQQEQLDRSYRQGIEMLRAGRAREAAGHLAIAAGLAPESPLILRALGNAYAYSNDLERAQRVLQASIELDPDVPGTHYELAQVALAVGDLDTALVESRRTAALDPGNPKASELLGMVLYRQGQLGEALTVLEPVASRQDSRPETVYTLALAYQGLERFEEARDALQAVVEQQPEHAEAWFNLGKVLAVLGDEAGAEEANAIFMRLSDNPQPPPQDEDANLPPGVGPS